jgi:site-specific DNA-methyltransferase (adenine-specific)
MMNNGMYSSKTPEWATPQSLFDELNNEFHFTLDPCSTDANAKCEKHYTIADDGLSHSWDAERVFMNPPYGRVIAHWVKKASKISDGGVCVCVLPARTDTRWFHEYIYGKTEIRFLKGRVRFNDEGPAPFPTMIVIFRGKQTPHVGE